LFFFFFFYPPNMRETADSWQTENKSNEGERAKTFMSFIHPAVTHVSSTSYPAALELDSLKKRLTWLIDSISVYTIADLIIIVLTGNCQYSAPVSLSIHTLPNTLPNTSACARLLPHSYICRYMLDNSTWYWWCITYLYTWNFEFWWSSLHLFSQHPDAMCCCQSIDAAYLDVNLASI
jgi:hypothetical protein